MSDTVVVMADGEIQQIGTPTDIYNEPKNAFVADFIGESNIVDGVMLADKRVRMSGHTFDCLDGGYSKNEQVDVVVRPEDVDVVAPENGMLTGIVERTKISTKDGRIYYTEDGVDTDLDPDVLVSMNLWGFTPAYLKECEARFPKFLDENLEKNPEKCEFFLPSVVSELISEGKADVRVLDNCDKWYGVTYKEDKEDVVNAFKSLKAEGVYPANF